MRAATTHTATAQLRRLNVTSSSTACETLGTRRELWLGDFPIIGVETTFIGARWVGPMLYILIVCGGDLCMPVENVGVYTLTEGKCEGRRMQKRVEWRGADLDCFSEDTWEFFDDKMVLYERKPSVVIAHPPRSE
jgi:hypothetical protein